MMMDMRKLANHPLLLRNYYNEKKLRKLASRLAADTFYKEKNEQYIYEDLIFMSDFQIHQLTFQYKVLFYIHLMRFNICSIFITKLEHILEYRWNENT